ncbi:unnamed protein product [Paramecium pentaurelia]|uniref:Uncharacterized protein n=1 Tax=Paramecium pentaurelia TaxID=43138 RepID=A0A8S1SEI6_9CILI|nr:unnamed protein product [Paramecium pentaurelia]
MIKLSHQYNFNKVYQRLYTKMQVHINSQSQSNNQQYGSKFQS